MRISDWSSDVCSADLTKAMAPRTMTTSSGVGTRRQSAPPAAPPAPPSATAPAGPRWWIAAVVAGLLVSFVVGSAFLPVPYVAMRPGTARPVTQYVTVRGATSYPPEESIAYMTVNIGQISLLEAAVGWLDDDVDIRPEEVI